MGTWIERIYTDFSEITWGPFKTVQAVFPSSSRCPNIKSYRSILTQSAPQSQQATVAE